MSEAERAEALNGRRRESRPWHSPPHRADDGYSRFHVAAACYEHQPHIGLDGARLDAFSEALLATLAGLDASCAAWCVLPNHYHLLVETTDILALLRAIGKLHGRTSHAWNGEEGTRGRSVFYRAVERAMRSDAHFWTTLNYIHHNPVHHRYAARWEDWPWSSATDYLAAVGSDHADRLWHDYPLLDYGRGWDDANL